MVHFIYVYKYYSHSMYSIYVTHWPRWTVRLGHALGCIESNNNCIKKKHIIHLSSRLFDRIYIYTYIYIYWVFARSYGCTLQWQWQCRRCEIIVMCVFCIVFYFTTKWILYIDNSHREARHVVIISIHCTCTCTYTTYLNMGLLASNRQSCQDQADDSRCDPINTLFAPRWIRSKKDMYMKLTALIFAVS